jgi:hypothetical protein
MNRAATDVDVERAGGTAAPWVGRLWLPALIAVAAVTIVLLLVVERSRSAWMILGPGRGLVPHEYFHVSGFVVVLATTFGQVAGWAGGSGVAYYLMTLLGFPRGWTTARAAMSLVYVGLGGLPLLVYHWLYGQWLLGVPRGGLEEWLRAAHPDAAWLLLTLHPVVDLSLLPLGVIFLGVLWGAGERGKENLAVQTGLALSLLATSLAVGLSLAIHATLVQIRL